MTGTCACAQDCGKPVYAKSYARNCYIRWDRSGRPESGPLPPKTGPRAKAGAPKEPPVAVNVTDRAVLLAAALVRCTAAGDELGIRELRLRVPDWEPVALMLARRLVAAAARQARPPVAAGRQDAWRAVSVALRAVLEASDAA